jgi:cell division protein ZapA
VSEVTITVNRRPYRLACEDGQEEHLKGLAERIDARVSDLIGKFGQIGDQQLLVMVGLLLADEAAELRRRLDAQEHLSAEHASAYEAADSAAAGVIDEMAERIEALAASVERAAEELAK